MYMCLCMEPVHIGQLSVPCKCYYIYWIEYNLGCLVCNVMDYSFVFHTSFENKEGRRRPTIPTSS